MAFSSVHEMIDLCKESGKPLYEVILESDLAESGLTRAESEAEMHRLWAVMQATSDGYCGADRSMSGFAGGDAAKVNAAAVRGVLYADGYFADVMAEALKTAECNACMKRIVAAPTAGSCGVLPAVLLPLQRRGLADEAANALPLLGTRIALAKPTDPNGHPAMEGVALGLSPTGSLLVATDDGRTHDINAGDVLATGLPLTTVHDTKEKRANN